MFYSCRRWWRSIGLWSAGGEQPTETSTASVHTVTQQSTEEMMLLFQPRRRLLYRRLWRSRCVRSDDDEALVQQQKSLVRQLTKILTVSQLETLAGIVQRCTCRLCIFHTHTQTQTHITVCVGSSNGNQPIRDNNQLARVKSRTGLYAN